MPKSKSCGSFPFKFGVLWHNGSAVRPRHLIVSTQSTVLKGQRNHYSSSWRLGLSTIASFGGSLFSTEVELLRFDCKSQASVKCGMQLHLETWTTKGRKSYWENHIYILRSPALLYPLTFTTPIHCLSGSIVSQLRLSQSVNCDSIGSK